MVPVPAASTFPGSSLAMQTVEPDADLLREHRHCSTGIPVCMRAWKAALQGTEHPGSRLIHWEQWKGSPSRQKVSMGSRSMWLNLTFQTDAGSCHGPWPGLHSLQPLTHILPPGLLSSQDLGYLPGAPDSPLSYCLFSRPAITWPLCNRLLPVAVLPQPAFYPDFLYLGSL